MPVVTLFLFPHETEVDQGWKTFSLPPETRGMVWNCLSDPRSHEDQSERGTKRDSGAYSPKHRIFYLIPGVFFLGDFNSVGSTNPLTLRGIDSENFNCAHVDAYRHGPSTEKRTKNGCISLRDGQRIGKAGEADPRKTFRYLNQE